MECIMNEEFNPYTYINNTFRSYFIIVFDTQLTTIAFFIRI
jgi:hypothetical protein